MKQENSFFVKESNLKDKADKKDKANNFVKDDGNAELGILVTAKKMGLSFEELNLFSLNDYIEFVDRWVGEEGQEQEQEGAVRHATQADIDFYMG